MSAFISSAERLSGSDTNFKFFQSSVVFVIFFQAPGLVVDIKKFLIAWEDLVRILLCRQIQKAKKSLYFVGAHG